VKECRLEERELVQPDTVADQEIEFLVANLVGPGIRRNRFPDEKDPVPAQAVFEQRGFEPKATSHSFEDAGERIDGTDAAHGGIIAKTSVAISSRLFQKSGNVSMNCETRGSCEVALFGRRRALWGKVCRQGPVKGTTYLWTWKSDA